jgi:hypothetical protein
MRLAAIRSVDLIRVSDEKKGAQPERVIAELAEFRSRVNYAGLTQRSFHAMTVIHFHNLERAEKERAICRLAHTYYEAGRRVLVLVGTEKQADVGNAGRCHVRHVRSSVRAVAVFRPDHRPAAAPRRPPSGVRGEGPSLGARVPIQSP